MCITEQKLVDAYANGNPHERFSLIYKNYEVFLQLVDSFETGLLNQILFEVEYNRRAKNDEDPDVESIINYMFDITRTVAEKMFAYGAALGEN